MDKDTRMACLQNCVAEAVCAATGLQLTPDDHLFESGVDSLNSIELHANLAASFRDIQLPSSLLFQNPSVGQLANFVDAVLWPTTDAIMLSQDSHQQEVVLVLKGMACRAAGDICNVQGFWNQLECQTNLISATPPSRWHKLVAAAFGAQPPAGMLYGAFMTHIGTFDNHFFGLQSAQTDLCNDTCILAEVIAEALYDAGYSVHSLARHSCSLYTAVAVSDFSHLGEYECSVSRHIAHILDVTEYTNVNTGCSSALVACQHAHKQLSSSEECQMSLVASSTLLLNPHSSNTVCQWGIMSPSGQVTVCNAIICISTQ